MKSKIIAIAIFIFVFLVPFRIAFLGPEIAHSVKFIFSFLATIIGFLIAFGIGTNRPFDRKKETEQNQKEEEQVRKAA